MSAYKVEICGVNTAKLPVLKEKEKERACGGCRRICGAAGFFVGRCVCLWGGGQLRLCSWFCCFGGRYL